LITAVGSGCPQCGIIGEGSASRCSSSTIYLHPGQMAVNSGKRRVITILGSCVSVCLWDPSREIGGVNHFLMPVAASAGMDAPGKFAATAVPELISRMVEAGARPQQMLASLFGGARIFSVSPEKERHLGLVNADAAREILRSYSIPVVHEDTGGDRARKNYMCPWDGSVRVVKLG